MPIRTHRGRAAVWRRVWGWPLTSYKHIAATGAAVVVVAMSVGVAAGTGSENTDQNPGRGEAAAPSSYTLPSTSYELPETSVSSPPTTQDSTPEPPSAEVPPPVAAVTAPPEALQVARDFTVRFARPGLPSEQWVDQLRPVVTAETAGLLGTVDPANVDVSDLAGEPVATKVTASVILIDVPVDTGVLKLTLLDTGGWKVRSYDKVER